MLGGVAAQAAGPAVEFALDLLDEFLLDGLRKGWHPRMFFDDLRKLDRIENEENKPVPAVIVGNSIRLASEVESGDALG